MHAVGAALALTLLVSSAAPASDEEERDAVVLGMSTALTGPFSDIGQGVRAGIELCISETNDNGGINGIPLELIVYDDGYEPKRTVPNMLRLIDEDRVLAIIGNVGTPTAISAFPIAKRKGVLFYGAFTGASVLRRTPPDAGVVNFRASYAEEAESIVSYLIEECGLNAEEIALFTQQDGYGDLGYAHTVSSLRAHGMSPDEPVLHVRYSRNTLDVEGALAGLLDAKIEPKAVIMFGTYAPCSKLIRMARENDFRPMFLSVSLVGPMSLGKELGDYSDGVVVTQVVPHFDSDLPIVEDYRTCLKRYRPDLNPTHVSLEGFIATRILVEGLRRTEGMPTRESIAKTIEGMSNVDVGLGFPISFSKDEHQACHRVWRTEIRDGKVVPIVSLECSPAGEVAP